MGATGIMRYFKRASYNRMCCPGRGDISKEKIMKVGFSVIFAAGFSLMAMAAPAASSYQVQFFGDYFCTAQAQIIEMSSPQTAQTCHQFALDHSLQNTPVLSY